MTNEEIVNNAKYIILPESAVDNPAHPYVYDYSNITSNRLPEPKSEDLYLNSPGNAHHYTTEYHLNNTLPELNKLLNFSYDINDFYKIENVNSEGDFSYLLPKQNKQYKTTSVKISEVEKEKYYVRPIIELINSNELVTVSKCFDEDSFGSFIQTPYHRLYKFAHSSAVIENLGSNNGKTLLVSHDSHCIPVIPILANYYKCVIALDNRFGFDIKDTLIQDKQIDDCLFVLWENNGPDKYFVKNLA